MVSWYHYMEQLVPTVIAAQSLTKFKTLYYNSL